MVRRSLWCTFAVWLLGAGLASGQQPAEAKSETASTQPTTTEIRKAEGAFKRALRLQAQPENPDNLSHALEALEESRELNPQEATYATTYEFVRQQLIASHLEKGDRLLQQGNIAEALAQYREVLALDPKNEVAADRLRYAVVASRPQTKAPTPAFDYASEPVLTPKPLKAPFDFRGDSRQLLSSIGKTFGIVVLFDDSTPSRTIRFKLDEADFFTAMRAATQATGTFYLPMSATQIIVAPDNADTRRRLEHLSLRTYQLSELSTAQELNDLATLLRAMLDVRFVVVSPGSSSITVRAPLDTLKVVDSLILDLSAPRPEIVLEIHAYQLVRSMNRNIGISLPLQFTIFNIGTEARALLNQSGNQGLIDSLIASGVVTAADAAAIAAALATQSGSPFLQPFAVFGGGKTLSGLVIPNLALKLDYSKMSVSAIQHMTLRASQGSAAVYRIGDRIPVLTSQYAPLINIPGQNPVSGRNGLIPSFNYEDLGITLKTTPSVSGNNEVTLKLELQIKALGGQSFNNVPTISERAYTGTVVVQDGQSSVLAGSISVQEQNSVNGLPWFSRIPLLGLAASTRGKQEVSSELLFVITPHVLRSPRPKDEATEMIVGGR